MSSLQDAFREHMNKLCLEIGSKHCGSAELDRAGAYIEERLQDWGLETLREQMPVTGWEFRGFTLYNLTQNRQVPGATACYFSNSVEIYDTALWITEDNLDKLDSLPVRGRLCMVAVWYGLEGVFGYNGIAERLDRMGAAAAIFLNRIHSQLAPSTKIERSPFLNTLGVAAVAHEGAIFIANHPHDRYYLKIQASKLDSTAYNVIARLGTGERKGVIGAHYDTAPLIQGAQDNTGGAVLLMELARLWKEKYPQGVEGWTLDFVAFTAEEYIPFDLPVGSGDYVKRHGGENLLFFLNIDDLAARFSHWEVELGTPWKLPELSFPHEVRPSAFSGDDKSFHAIGVPTIWITGRKLFHELHTALDDISHTDFALMEKGLLEYDDLLTQLTESDRWERKARREPAIRPAEPRDYSRMAEIGAAAWEPIYEGYKEQLGEELFQVFYAQASERKRRNVLAEAESCTCFVGELDGRVVAFANCAINNGIGEIRGNAVDPAYSGCGIGGRMQEYVLRYMREHGCGYAFVDTGLDEAHAPARRVYEKNGFEKSLPSIKYFRKL